MPTFQILDSLSITPRILSSVRAIAESKGKEELFTRQIPQALETLRKVSVIQSTESSNRIEGVVADHSRIVALVEEKTKPATRDESEIAGYRAVLNLIHQSWQSMPFTPGLVQQLHRDLFQYSEGGGGDWKVADNTITETLPDGEVRTRFRPTPAWQVQTAMEDLHAAYERALRAGIHDPLILIPAYVLDFLCIHPFMDGNGRVGRLLTLLLLYKSGYEVGRYISLEREVEVTKESYYEALGLSSTNWHESKHNPIPWIEYFLSVMLQGAYKRFQGRVGELTFSRGSKKKMVHDAIRSQRGPFTVADIVQECPTISVDLIRRELQILQAEGEVMSTGRGPGVKWITLQKSELRVVMLKDVISDREVLEIFLADVRANRAPVRIVIPHLYIERLFPHDLLGEDEASRLLPDYEGLQSWAAERGFDAQFVPESGGLKARPVQFIQIKNHEDH